MLKTNEMAILKSRNVIRKHYGLKNSIYLDAEVVEAELNNLNRHYVAVTLDNFYEPLYYKIEKAQATM